MLESLLAIRIYSKLSELEATTDVITNLTSIIILRRLFLSKAARITQSILKPARVARQCRFIKVKKDRS